MARKNDDKENRDDNQNMEENEWEEEEQQYQIHEKSKLRQSVARRQEEQQRRSEEERKMKAKQAKKDKKQADNSPKPQTQREILRDVQNRADLEDRIAQRRRRMSVRDFEDENVQPNLPERGKVPKSRINQFEEKFNRVRRAEPRVAQARVSERASGSAEPSVKRESVKRESTQSRRDTQPAAVIPTPPPLPAFAKRKKISEIAKSAESSSKRASTRVASSKRESDPSVGFEFVQRPPSTPVNRQSTPIQSTPEKRQSRPATAEIQRPPSTPVNRQSTPEKRQSRPATAEIQRPLSTPVNRQSTPEKRQSRPATAEIQRPPSTPVPEQSDAKKEHIEYKRTINNIREYFGEFKVKKEYENPDITKQAKKNVFGKTLFRGHQNKHRKHQIESLQTAINDFHLFKAVGNNAIPEPEEVRKGLDQLKGKIEELNAELAKETRKLGGSRLQVVLDRLSDEIGKFEKELNRSSAGPKPSSR